MGARPPVTCTDMASVEKRAGKPGPNGEPTWSWRVYWRQGGRDGQKQSTTWPNEKLAHRANDMAKAHKHQISADEVYSLILGIPLRSPFEERPHSPTVSEWAAGWLKSRTRITPGVRGRYQAQLDNEILPRIGDLRLDDVTGTHIAELLAELRGGRMDSTVTRYYAVLHGLFEWAVIEGKIPSNPARRTDWIRDLVAHDDTGEESHAYLSRAEFDLIYRAADERARPLLRFLVDTGCRWSEATAVQVVDVNVLGRVKGVRVRQAWKQDEAGKWYLGSTKGRNRRTVTMPAGLVDELVPLVATTPTTKLLFRAPRGGRMGYSNFRARFWLPAVAAAARCPDHPPLLEDGAPDRDRLAMSTCDCPTRLRQIPTIHDLRHTHAAWLIALGRQMAYISKRLGHHSTTITERVYAGILPEVDEGAMAAYDEATAAAAGVAPGESEPSPTRSGTSVAAP